MPTQFYDQIGGAMAFMDAPFAIHPYDKQRARAYRTAAKKAGVTMAEALNDVRAYCASRGASLEKTSDQVRRAEKYFKGHLA